MSTMSTMYTPRLYFKYIKIDSIRKFCASATPYDTEYQAERVGTRIQAYNTYYDYVFGFRNKLTLKDSCYSIRGESVVGLSWSGFMVLVALATLKALQYNKEDRGYLPTVMLYAKVSDVYKYVGSLCYDYAYI